MQTPIQVSKKEIEWINIFTFMWAIDESNADSTFKTIFENYIWNKLIFDFWLLTYGNSKFLGYLSKMYEFTTEKEWVMYIVNCVEPLKDTLEACGTFLIIPNKPTLNEALIEMWVKINEPWISNQQSHSS